MTDTPAQALSVLALGSSPQERGAAAETLLDQGRAIAPRAPSVSEGLAIVLQEAWHETHVSRAEIVSGLVETVRTDPSLLTIEVAAEALALEGEDGVTELLTLGGHTDFAIQSKVVIGLSLLGRSARWAVPTLIRFLDKEPLDYVAHLIVTTLGRIGGREAITKLGQLASAAERESNWELAAEIKAALEPAGVPARMPTGSDRRPFRSRVPYDAVRQTTPLEAILLEEHDFLEHDGDLLVCWGIFNPYGPTWSCLGRLRTEIPDVDLLFYRMLNPFHQKSVAVSSLVGTDRADGRFLGRTLHELFVGNIAGAGDETLYLVGDGSAPTFVLVPWDNPEFRSAVPDLFKHSPGVLRADLAQDIDYMRRYRGRPWDRATDQMNKALSAGRRSDNASASRRAAADTTLADAWYDLIQDPEHVTGELVAFPEAWSGAIDVQRNSEHGQNAYVLRLLDQFLVKFGFPVFRQTAAIRIADLIKILETLRDAVRANDWRKAFEGVTALVTRFIDVFGESSEITVHTSPLFKQLTNDIRAEDYDGAMGAVLALLARFRETQDWLASRGQGGEQ